MNSTDLHLMMLDIDGVLSRHGATAVDLLTAAQLIAVSAVGDLVNESSGTGSADTSEATDQVPVPSDSVPVPSDSLHGLADDIAEQIRAALHKRIDEGAKPDW